MIQILVILICLLINAFLSAFEMAFVTVSKSELRQLAQGQKTSHAGRLLAMRENPERVLSVLQIGITLVGALSAAVGGAGAEESLAPHFENWFSIREQTAEAIAICVVVIPLTYISVVIGELVPKTLALRHASRIALAGAPALLVAQKILGPIVSFLETSTRAVTSILPSPSKAAATPVESSVDVGDLTGSHQQYVFNLVNIEKRRIRDIMLPRDRVEMVRCGESVTQVLGRMVGSGHTRLPVLKDGDVIGILHSKEFMVFVGGGSKDWEPLVRPAIAVTGSDGILATMRKLQDQKKHMAIVRGPEGVVGIVTLEDIIEEIVGEIYDEDDDGNVKRLLARRAGFKARLP